jgi:hypothetical protein
MRKVMKSVAAVVLVAGMAPGLSGCMAAAGLAAISAMGEAQHDNDIASWCANPENHYKPDCTKYYRSLPPDQRPVD